MKTKNYYVPIVGKSNFVNTEDNRYSNLNLNQNQRYSSASPVQIKSGKNESKKTTDYDVDKSSTLQTRNHTTIWEKREKDSANVFQNHGNLKEQPRKNLNKNSSTLSLHIAAYENSFEVVGSNLVDDEQKKKILTSVKKWKNAKQIFTNKSSLIQDPFCLPRQQQQQNTEEIAKFKVSEAPFNPKSAARGHAKQGSARITRSQANGTRKSERINKQKQNAEKQEDPDSSENQRKKSKPKRSNGKSEPITCYDNSGVPVDWFLIIKSPLRGYYYIDSAMLARGERRMIRFDNIFSKDSALYRTMAQFYDNQEKEDFLGLAFNDDHKTPPPKKGGAHSKGMVFHKGEHGVYISHSVPFLPDLNMNRFPATARRKAQHVLALNINREALETISEHLWITQPDIYFPKVPESYFTIGKLEEIKKSNFSTKLEEFKTSHLTTRGGYSFSMHSRSHSEEEASKFIPSLWDQIPIHYGQTVYLQTFYSAGQECESCIENEHTIINIEGIQARDTRQNWTKGSDHCKMGFGEESNHIILGDLNHTKTKITRGGTLVVIPDPNLVETYDNTFEYKLLLPKKK